MNTGIFVLSVLLVWSAGVVEAASEDGNEKGIDAFSRVVIEETARAATQADSNQADSNQAGSSRVDTFRAPTKYSAWGDSAKSEGQDRKSDGSVTEGDRLRAATEIARAEMAEIDRLFYRLTDRSLSAGGYGEDLTRLLLRLGQFQLLDTGHPMVNRLLVRDYTLARYGDLLSVLAEDPSVANAAGAFERALMLVQMGSLADDLVREQFGAFNERQRKRYYSLLEELRGSTLGPGGDELDWVVIRLMGYERDAALLMQLAGGLEWHSQSADSGRSTAVGAGGVL